MKHIHLDYDEFMSYNKIKPGIVHLHNGIIYKNSPGTNELVDIIEKTKTNPVMKHISLPTAKLFIEDCYFGYTYKFNNKLRQVIDAIFLGIIANEEQFILELIDIIEKFNQLGLCYWDFHKNNIFSDQEGHPYLLDIDDIRTEQTRLNRYLQIKYLTEFIIDTYLDTDKTLQQILREPIIKKTLKETTIKYIETLIRRNEQIVDLPFCVIEELSNPHLKELIKTNIK